MNKKENIESLIVKYLNGTIAPDEHRELTSWLSLSAENQSVFDQMREIWLVSKLNDEKFDFDFHAAFERFRKETAQDRPIPRFRNPKPRRVITLSYRWAAAVVLLTLIGGALMYRALQSVAQEPDATAYQEITVPYGARSKVLLPDGSYVVLNAGTTLRYRVDFGKAGRDLWLDGEGYFTVSKSTTPFMVHSGTVQIKALGTQFNVRAYSSEKTVETTLVEGKVAVSDTRPREKGHNEEITLLPNQKLIVAKDETGEKINISPTDIDDTEIQPIKASIAEPIKQEKIDPLPDISWKDNEWVIYRESLESLAVKMERRFDIHILFTDEHLKSFRYNGTLPDESLEQVLDVMCLVSPIKYSVKGKTVVFSENSQFK